MKLKFITIHLLTALVAALTLTACHSVNQPVPGDRVMVFWGDHGTFSFKRVDADDSQALVEELIQFTSHVPPFFLMLDDDPGRIFYYGLVLPNGQKPIFSTDLEGRNVSSNVVAGLRRPTLDRYGNLLVYEVLTGGAYQLRTQSYTSLGSTNFTVLLTNQYTFNNLHVNPDKCGKIFWLEDRQDQQRFLMEYDKTNGTVRQLIGGSNQAWLRDIQYFAIDPRCTNLYWSQKLDGSVNDLIGRVNYMDGSGYTRWIVNDKEAGTGVSYPAEIAVDYEGRRIYWTDMNLNWVASAAMTGTNLIQREFRVIARYPRDMGTQGPNYHPTGIGLIRLKPLPASPQRPVKKVRNMDAAPLPSIGDYTPPAGAPEFPFPYEN